MTLYMTLLLAAALFPLLAYSDYKQKIKADNNPDIEFDYNHRATTLLMTFIPFSILFYTENFWINFLWLAPLYGYFWIIIYFTNKKPWSPFTAHDITLYGSSGFTGTILAYFIWFHKGSLAVDSTITATSKSANISSSVWPYYVFASIVILMLLASYAGRKLKEKYSRAYELPLLLATLSFPILPLFIYHYWWGVLASIITYLILLNIAMQCMSDSARGGVGFAFSYIYMMALTLSIIIYAIWF